MARAAIVAMILGLFATTARAQQSLFNIPSTEVTTGGHSFFQQQFAVSSHELQSNSTYCYGLGGGFEIGFDLWNLDFGWKDHFHVESTVYDRGEAASPIALASALYAHHITDWWKAGVGVVLGTNLAAPVGARLVGLLYQSNVFELPWGIRFHLGLFAATPALAGRDSVIANFFTGIEVPLLGPELMLVADHYQGEHGLGLTVAGFAWAITPKMILSVGYQEPNHPSELPRGVVVEFTFPPQEETVR